MQALILPSIFLVLAAFFKAVADTLSFHFDRSIFKWKDKRFWNPAISWKYTTRLKFTKYPLDAWHLAHSAMIVCFCAGICLHESLTRHWFEPLISIFLSGLLFNLAFNLFYNKILLKP